MLRRLLDITFSLTGLIVTSPILIPTMIAVWLQDYNSPFYIAPRMGKSEVPFKMVKLRSMMKNADKTGVDSTSANDMRITKVGHFIRRYKLDELIQLWNVLKGDMSLVGPRPNVKRETDLYTPIEKRLLTVRPGITDLASIVFADEGDILKDSKDPDLDYNQRIRPWKSRLALLTLDSHSVVLYFKIIFLTAIAIVSRERALTGVHKIVEDLGAPADVTTTALRQQPLKAYPPPGANEIVMSRS